MGLDLLVMNKPKSGYEEEFRLLMTQWFVHHDIIHSGELGEEAFFETVENGPFRLDDEELDDLMHRADDISVPAYAALGAPLVGRDPAADAWVRRSFAEGRFEANVASADEALRALDGQYVLALLPESDGLPVYNNSEFGLVDETSFRGAFLDDCLDILDESVRAEVWGVMWPDDLLSYGQTLANAARDYAMEQGLTGQLGQRLVDWKIEGEPSAQLHIVDSLARWAKFWGGRGHGCYPYF